MTSPPIAASDLSAARRDYTALQARGLSLDLTRGKPSAEQLDLAALAEDALEQAGEDIRTGELTLTTALHPAPFTGDAHLVERMVWNLVDNAVRHNVAAGWIRLSTGTDDGAAYLRIANGGPAVADAAVSAFSFPSRRG